MEYYKIINHRKLIHHVNDIISKTEDNSYVWITNSRLELVMHIGVNEDNNSIILFDINGNKLKRKNNIMRVILIAMSKSRNDDIVRKLSSDEIAILTLL